MVDLAIGVEGKNYSLKRGSDLKTFLEPLGIMLPLFVVACALSFQIWLRAQNIQIGYQTQQLKKQAEKLVQRKQRLVAEAQTLRHRESLNLAVRNNPGVIILRANLALPPASEYRDRSGSQSPDLETLVRLPGTQKASALN